MAPTYRTQSFCQADFLSPMQTRQYCLLKGVFFMIVGFSVYGSTFAHLFTHYPIAWTVKRSNVGTRVLAVL